MPKGKHNLVPGGLLKEMQFFPLLKYAALNSLRNLNSLSDDMLPHARLSIICLASCCKKEHMMLRFRFVQIGFHFEDREGIQPR